MNNEEKAVKALERIAFCLETLPLPEILEELNRTKATNKNLIEIAKSASRD